MNLALGVDYGKWEFSLYGKNITNNTTIIQRPEINTVFEGYTVRPVTLGATLKYRFGE
jgi:iron complex outermembrane receptor protein